MFWLWRRATDCGIDQPMPHLLIFGLGYTASRLAAVVRGAGWQVTGTARAARDGAIAFDDTAAVRAAMATATHTLSSVPPDRATGGDPVLARYGEALAAHSGWLGYLSSTGVYGDTGGAWVDETARLRGGRVDARAVADLAWQALSPRTHIFRLPGIYGPGRSALDRVADGSATRILAPGHVFSRIHVDDIVATLIAATERPAPGVYNVADGAPASGADVLAHAAALLGVVPPPLVPLADAKLSPMARSFYDGCRRVAATKIRRVLGVHLRYPDYRSGLAACLDDPLTEGPHA